MKCCCLNSSFLQQPLGPHKRSGLCPAAHPVPMAPVVLKEGNDEILIKSEFSTFLALNSNRYQSTVETGPGKGLFCTEREAQEGQQLLWGVCGAETALQSCRVLLSPGRAGRARLAAKSPALGQQGSPRFSRITLQGGGGMEAQAGLTTTVTPAAVAGIPHLGQLVFGQDRPSLLVLRLQEENGPMETVLPGGWTGAGGNPP